MNWIRPPAKSHGGWQTRSTRTAFQTDKFRVREDQVVIPGAGQVPYAYLERGPGVVVVPVTRDNQIVLLRQYRYPVNQFCLEVPAGTAHDVPGQPLEAVAAKELLEEIGARFVDLERVGSFFSADALTDEECHVFLAWGVQLSDLPHRQPTEHIEIRPTPASEVVELARRGEIKTAQSALALLLCEPRLRARGSLLGSRIGA